MYKVSCFFIEILFISVVYGNDSYFSHPNPYISNEEGLLLSLIWVCVGGSGVWVGAYSRWVRNSRLCAYSNKSRCWCPGLTYCAWFNKCDKFMSFALLPLLSHKRLMSNWNNFFCGPFGRPLILFYNVSAVSWLNKKEQENKWEEVIWNLSI